MWHMYEKRNQATKYEMQVHNTVVMPEFFINQGAWSLSERSHWSFWLDIICLGENKFGRNP